MEDNNDRYTQAFVLRLDASAARRKALFFAVLAVVSAFVHVPWLVLVCAVFVIILLLVSVALNGEANKLWPNPKDFKDE